MTTHKTRFDGQFAMTAIDQHGKPHPQAPKPAPDKHGLIYLPDSAFPTAFAQNAAKDELARLEVWKSRLAS